MESALKQIGALLEALDGNILKQYERLLIEAYLPDYDILWPEGEADRILKKITEYQNGEVDETRNLDVLPYWSIEKLAELQVCIEEIYDQERSIIALVALEVHWSYHIVQQRLN